MYRDVLVQLINKKGSKMAYKISKFNSNTTTRFATVKEDEVSASTKGMLDMLKIEEHSDVVAQVIGDEADKFDIYTDKMWTIFVPKSLKKDDKVPMVCAHTDTVSNIHPKAFSYTNLAESYICNKEEKLIGADDRLGCWLIQQLILSNSQDFIFALFDQEEVGGIGSADFVNNNAFDTLNGYVSCYLGLDRKGHNEMASYSYESDEFLEVLEKIEGWVPDMGSFTDVASLAEAGSVSCVNFSVGYYNEHTRNEYFSPTECENTLEVMQNLPKELWGTTYTCEAYGWGRGYYSSYTYSDDSFPNFGKTCERCEAEMFDDEEGNICMYCKQEVEDIIECEYCGTTFLDSDKFDDGYGSTICKSCYEFTEVQDEDTSFYTPVTNQQYCAYIVTNIMKEDISMNTKKIMKDINLVSYFSKFEDLKDDQVEKLNVICEYYGLTTR